MTQPAYGVTFVRDNRDPRPAIHTDFSVIGLVLPSDDANATSFPLNEPVMFDSSDINAITKMGTGELAQAVNAIDAQLADFQTSARIVAVRVAKGTDEWDTMDNIIGEKAAVTADGNVGTGLYALLRAGSQLGIIPRLIGVPGYTHQVLTPDPALAAATLKTGTKAVSSPQIATEALVKTSSGRQIVANPVVAALPEICSSLLAHAIVSAPRVSGFETSHVIDWMETLTSGRLIPVSAWRKVYNDADIKTPRLEDGVAALLGIAARTDFNHAGLPFWSFSGQQMHGTLGLDHYYPFSLTDGATQGQWMLANRIGVLLRGEIGVDTAIASNGFVFAGVWNADDDPLWWFYNKTRGRDWTHLALLRSIRKRLGVENVTPHGVQSVLNDMVVVGQELINHECSVGFKVSFEKDKNSPDNLRQGKFRVAFASEEPAPITHVTVDSRPNYQALVEELGTLIAQAASLPAVYLRA